MDGTSLIPLQNPQTQMVYKHDEDYIKKLSKEILDGLDKQNISLLDEQPLVTATPPKPPKPAIHDPEIESKKIFIDNIFKHYFNVKDFFLIVAIYFLMSLDSVKTFFMDNIPALNPNDEGVVGISGILIYGVILAVLFIVFRNFI